MDAQTSPAPADAAQSPSYTSLPVILASIALATELFVFASYVWFMLTDR